MLFQKLLSVLIAAAAAVLVTKFLRQGRYRRAALLMAPALAAAGVFAAFSSTEDALPREFEQALFGKAVSLNRVSYRYESKADFSGDGHAFLTYRLNPDVRKLFTETDSAALTALPSFTPKPAAKAITTWRPSPIPESLVPVLDSALCGLDRQQNWELAECHVAVMQALRRSGCWFAAVHGPGSTSFYVVDPERDEFHLIWTKI